MQKEESHVLSDERGGEKEANGQAGDNCGCWPRRAQGKAWSIPHAAAAGMPEGISGNSQNLSVFHPLPGLQNLPGQL